MKTHTKQADLFIVYYRSAGRSAADLQKIYRLSTDYLQSVCSNDLQQLCKFADSLQTKSKE